MGEEVAVGILPPSLAVHTLFWRPVWVDAILNFESRSTSGNVGSVTSMSCVVKDVFVTIETASLLPFRQPPS